MLPFQYPIAPFYSPLPCCGSEQSPLALCHWPKAALGQISVLFAKRICDGVFAIGLPAYVDGKSYDAAMLSH